MFTHDDLRTITDPTRRPDLPEDFPPIDADDLEARRRARIDAQIEEAMRAHPSSLELCPECGAASPCRKCRRGLTVIDGGLA